MKTRSGLTPLALVVAILATCVLQFCSGCATATRVDARNGDKSISLVLPKNLTASKLDADFDPQTGTVRLRATNVRSDGSKVIDSAAGAIGEVADAAKTLAPLAR